MSDEIKLMFAKERVTKNTIRFVEQNETDETIVGTLYIQKSALKLFGNPDHLMITISDAFIRCKECNKNIVDKPSDVCPTCDGSKS